MLAGIVLEPAALRRIARGRIAVEPIASKPILSKRLVSEPARRRCAALSAAACALWPALASATSQCPPEFGEKSTAFWALGGAIFAAFVLLGLALPVLALRLSRGRRGWVRAAWTAGACVAMLGCWLAGLLVFVANFTMVC